VKIEDNEQKKIKEWGEEPLSFANRDNFVTPSNKDIYLLVVGKSNLFAHCLPLVDLLKVILSGL